MKYAALVIPEVLIGIGRNMVSPAGLYAAATVRVGIGLVLVLAAREARAPGLLRAIGAVVLVVGVATPLFGVDAARARLEWEAAHLTLFRIEGAMFIGLGCVIVSAIQSLRS